MRKMFDTFDTNRDGCITYEDLEKDKGTDQYELFKGVSLDRSRDDKVSFDELFEAMTRGRTRRRNVGGSSRTRDRAW
ncbi:EF-hand domain-containing protein [Streptomyces sp. NPDC057540]|uniref:EF-hand domain-containing protein n=1 Tax=Streptomyces sp. NPDC057540 TaxID=3346160 RepID=UPI00367616FB